MNTTRLTNNSATKIRWKILVFPCGTENAIEIWNSLRACKEVLLYGAASIDSHHGSYIFENYFRVKPVSDPKWFDDINRIIDDYGIDYIFPANDIVIDALNSSRSIIKCNIILPSQETVRIARSKLHTLQTVKYHVPCPKVFHTIDEVDSFPIFVKPDKMYGSQGAQIVQSRKILEELLRESVDMILQEYLPGKEVTVDCFTDRNSKLIVSSARERIRVRMGTSMNAKLLDNNEQSRLRTYAQEISNALHMRGAWFFQMKQNDSGEWRFLEVGVRIAGTMALNRVMGINFPLMSLWDMDGIDVSVIPQNFDVEIDRSLHNRYRHTIQFTNVYVDLDDTIVCHNKLNIDIIKFLYQCLNEKKRIILLTKSLHQDLDHYLMELRIKNLFDEIIHISENDNKSNFISQKSSIFIDDSFSNRLEVFEKLHIPVFDSSMVELLLNDKS